MRNRHIRMIISVYTESTCPQQEEFRMTAGWNRYAEAAKIPCRSEKCSRFTASL